MPEVFKIRPLENNDIQTITTWARIEGFAPGIGDIGIYRNTDRQGIWVGCIDNMPIGCIAGIKYNKSYGFIGLFIVLKQFRGKGYGIKLWKHALSYLKNIPCIGLEAAPDRINDYSGWGFMTSSTTTRWQWEGDNKFLVDKLYLDSITKGLKIIDGQEVPSKLVELYDENRENNHRPHFLADWLHHSAGRVLVLIDENGFCHGFGRIRPCLLKNNTGWRIGPLIADTPPLAEVLLRRLVGEHSGVVLLDSPGLNQYSKYLLERLGFNEVSNTFRMYKGNKHKGSLNQVYGLTCLELG